ncbi:late endosomal lysosomal adaptor and MAPK and MTOR activator domain-containing protein [Rutstroemia sp. NJR-2017a WRK4]|nr:late endosomal lysosomal adaptor and MAPK and MTOR activator domain-containing protein [Rutstroemia sp. NJR-2017a WRK4]
MGNCSSCLGLDRARDLSDEDENSRLLFDDAHPNHYGSFGDPNSGIVQADPQEVQRETEALQKVVAQTSNHLVDIFAMVPQNLPRAPSITMFTGQDARLLRYQDVLAKMTTQDESNNTKHPPVEGTHPISDGWISDDEDVEEMKKHKPVKSEDVGPLLGGFADAESAME